jgi:hypothetical protein
MFGVALRPCTIKVTALFLPQSDATVWLPNHAPNERLEWWTTQVPISGHGEVLTAQIRNLQFDIQLPVARFREQLSALGDHGVELYLLERPVPNTLTLTEVPEADRGRILKDNGLIARFYLPHSHEVAWLATPARETLERWLDETQLSEWLQEPST